LTERATFAALVLLLAAGTLMQSSSPAVRAMAGSYEAELVTAQGSIRCILTLATDSTAAFRATPQGGEAGPVSYAGGWISDGGTIQVVLKNPDDPSNPVAVTLDPRDGSFVVKDIEGRRSPYVGLTFVRTGGAAAVSEPIALEKS